MFQETIIEIIQRVESLKQKKRSIVELDIKEIQEEIQETLFTINFTPDTINDMDLEEVTKLNVSPKEALGLFFLTFVATLRYELSYNSFWVGIEDALMEFEEDNNTFFVDNYFDDSEPNSYLNQAILEAIIRFNLRDGYDNGKPTDTLLLQMGILNRFTNINYWLTSNSKNSIINELTDRTHENFSDTFFSGWKIIQQYSQSLLTKDITINHLKENVWFKDFNLEDLLSSSKVSLHSPLISRDDIKSDLFLESVQYKNDELEFTLNGGDFYSLDLYDNNYDIFIDGELKSKLLKDENTNKFFLENSISIKEPENYKVKIEIKDKLTEAVYMEDFVLFDFNHDILIFDEDGRWHCDHNRKLDEKKVYSILIDSDFEVNTDEDNISEYFEGYVHLITNITQDSNFEADDGDEFQFSLNFNEQIKAPLWLNNLELYAMSDFLSFDEPIQYKLKYNKIAISARQTDELIPIQENISIVRWTYTGGCVYDLDSIDEFTYDMDLTFDILLNRKNTLKIKINDKVFTKQLNVTLIEKTANPKYRTFLRDKDDNLELLKSSNKLTQFDIAQKQIIITSCHEDFVKQPELKTQILRDKATIFDRFEVNKPFYLKNYPYYEEEISSVKKIYDDIRWNTFCSISINGIVKNYDENSSVVTLHANENEDSTLTLITLDKEYKLHTNTPQAYSNTIDIPNNTLGFCFVSNNEYLGSYFIEKSLDIETIFTNTEVLKFLRLSYFPFAEYFNDTGYEKNRALREKARNDKKKAKRLLRICIKDNPSIFLKAFLDEEFTLNDTNITINFDHSKTMVEQILFAIEFDEEESIKIIHEIVLNRWQEKMVQLPMFLIYLLNQVKNDRYYQIFLDELSENIETPDDVNEEFIERMINALLSNHKIDRFEKINIKTITQGKYKDFYIRKAINKIIEIKNTPLEVKENDVED
ncbi:hypothetical protein ALC152_00350 [Arcobacter sp. 15-2]|uniref:hypothetical protein n=1 Tax=Arcobacter sp. 15-2 TaxID=3374109 RepID=UPI00399C8931